MSDLREMIRSPKISHVNPKTIRVLLIEDNLGDARFVKEILSEVAKDKLSFFDLKHVTRVHEGLSLLGQENFEVILLDLSLPDGFGLSMVNQVCTRFSYLPVIVLTSLDDETIAIQAVQEGAQDYLVKGQMDGNLLIRAIQYAIERKRTEEKLRESEKIFRQLAENIREVFYICEHDLRHPLYISPAYEEIWGRPCKSFYEDPKSFWGAIHPNDKDRITGSLSKRSEREVMEIYRISRPDGSFRWIKERSTPIRDGSGKVYRIVEIATDITDQKLREDQLKSLGFHDPLTGLYNRAYFEEEMLRIEKARYDSVGVISCDIDGLKLVNDTFGHHCGDNLILAAANAMRGVFREADVVARIGGDEFSAILPNTDRAVIQDICQRIEEAVARYSISNPNLPLSISVGFAVTNDVPINLKDVLKEADHNMYRRKLHQAQRVHSSIVQALMNTLKARDLISTQHVDHLEEWLVHLAEIIGIPKDTIHDLRLLAKFHDIGKIGVPDHILFKEDSLTAEERVEIQRHCEIGYRIALSAPQLIPIADWILKHHEWWDGRGYPLGLQREEIPIECRMLTIADAYEALTCDRPYRKAFSPEEAVAELRNRSGTQFDPDIVDQFVSILEIHSPDTEIKCNTRGSISRGERVNPDHWNNRVGN